MKKRILLYVVLWLTISLALTCSVSALGVELQPETTAEPFSREWIENTVLPKFLGFLMSSGVTLVYLLPSVFKIKKASGRFDGSADDIASLKAALLERELTWETEKQEFRKTIEDLSVAYQDQLKHFAEIAESYDSHLEESEERIQSVARHVENMTEKTERMVFLAFTNSRELVANGMARMIAKVEEEGHEAPKS